jgi:hypothetical protein
MQIQIQIVDEDGKVLMKKDIERVEEDSVSSFIDTGIEFLGKCERILEDREIPELEDNLNQI